MNKIKFFAWTIAILLVMIIIFSGLNAIAGTGELPEAGIEAFVEKGNAWFRAADQGEWSQVFGKAKLVKGDSLKTDVNSQVRILFFDSQEMIVDENTELIITEGLIDQQNPFLTKVKVNLINGQIWSRLLELLHPDAAFEVESGSIVATVRGTTFNFKKEPTVATVSVFQSKVSMRLIENEKALTDVNSGQVFTYDFTTQKHTLEKSADRKLFGNVKEDQWLLMNILRDRDFFDVLREARQKKLDRVGSLPGERLYSTKLAVENVLAKIFGESRFAADVANKRAVETAAVMDKSVRSGLRLADGYGVAKNYNFLRLEAMDPDFISRLARQPWLRLYFYNQVFAEAQQKFVESKVDKASGFTTEETKSADDEILLEKVQQLITSSNSDVAAPSTTVPAGTITDNDDTAANDSTVINNGTADPKTETAPASASTTETSTTDSTSNSATTATPTTPTITLTVPKVNVVDSKTLTNTKTVAVPATPVSLEVTATQTNLSARDKSVMTANLVYSDKTKKDVTTEASWSLGADDATGRAAGSLVKNVFTANAEGGKAYITATYRTGDGQSFTGKITLTVLVLQS